jgi:hypothetical protein
MMKWLRKYTKQMLAVVVSLLLVSWLAGTALTTMLQTDDSKKVIGEAYGQEFDRRQLMLAGNEANILSSLGIPWQAPWALITGPQQAGILPPLKELDWMLLKLEAQDQGISVSQGEVDRLVEQIDPTGARLQQVKDNLRLATEDLRSAIGSFACVLKVAQGIGAAAKVSEPELKRGIVDIYERAKVNLVVLDAEKTVDESVEVSDEALRQQFDEHRDMMAAESEDGFGYRWSDRVKVQIIRADRDMLLPLVRVSEKEAREYWRNNKESDIFKLPGPEPIASQPTSDEAGSQPATDSVQSQPTDEGPRYFTTFAEAEEAAVEARKLEKANAAAQTLIRDLSTQLSVDFAEGPIEPGKDGFRIAPESVKSPGYYQKVIEQFKNANRFGQALVLEEPTDFISADAAGELDGVGTARISISGRLGPGFGDLVPLVQGLKEIPEDDSQMRQLYLSRYQTCALPLKDDDNNYYLYRVVDVAKSAAPKSLEEVRDRVKQDVLIKRSMAEAAKVAERLLAEAKADSLEAAWADEEALKTQQGEDNGYQSPPPFSRRGFGSMIGNLGESEELVKACFGIAEAGPTTQPDRLMVVHLPKLKKVVVVELVEVNGVQQMIYNALRPSMYQQLMMQRQAGLMIDWFDGKNIAERTGYVNRLGGNDPDSEESESEAG